MARKNLLASITGQPVPAAEHEARAEYTRRGASRSMMMAIDEMAENAKRMAAGETIVGLDPALIDGSFVSDRMQDDPQDFALLVEAIREHGQSTPILVRPHPDVPGRYMVVFGHRRTRAARVLGLPVRAIVKQLEDIAHIIAQGQENAARANLTFIERALFARKLVGIGQEKQTIRAALGVDETLLSRMLSITDVIPASVIEALGPSRSVGRDRWEELKKALLDPKMADVAKQVIASEGFASAGSGQFAYLLGQLTSARRKPKKAQPHNGGWASPDREVEASFVTSGRSFSLKLSAKDAVDFGKFISDHLDELYVSFEAARKPNNDGV